MIKLLLIFPAFWLSSSYQPFYLHKLDDYPEAKCLDGSSPAFYLSKAQSRESQNKFVILFNGGGWCGEAESKVTVDQTLRMCKNKAKGFFGSSQSQLPIKLNSIGILSGDYTNNPYFYDWNRIEVMYCDGTIYQGNLKDPVNVEGELIWFRGEQNTISLFDALINKFNIQNAEEILLVGSSAGGISTAQWVNYFRDLLPTKVKLWLILDSAFFPDIFIDRFQENILRQKFINIIDIIYRDSQPIAAKECMSIHRYEQWKCFFLYNLLQYIKVPIFIIQSYYDAFLIADVFKYNCIHHGVDGCYDQIIKPKIRSQALTIKQQILEVQMNKTNIGVWLSHSNYHCFVSSKYRFHNKDQLTIPSASDNTVSYSIFKWMYQINDNYNWQYIDDLSQLLLQINYSAMIILLSILYIL